MCRMSVNPSSGRGSAEMSVSSLRQAFSTWQRGHLPSAVPAAGFLGRMKGSSAPSRVSRGIPLKSSTPRRLPAGLAIGEAGRVTRARRATARLCQRLSASQRVSSQQKPASPIRKCDSHTGERGTGLKARLKRRSFLRLRRHLSKVHSRSGP